MSEIKGDVKLCPYCGSTNITTTLSMNIFRPKEINFEHVKCLDCKQNCYIEELFISK